MGFHISLVQFLTEDLRSEDDQASTSWPSPWHSSRPCLQNGEGHPKESLASPNSTTTLEAQRNSVVYLPGQFTKLPSMPPFVGVCHNVRKVSSLLSKHLRSTKTRLGKTRSCWGICVWSVSILRKFSRWAGSFWKELPELILCIT